MLSIMFFLYCACNFNCENKRLENDNNNKINSFERTLASVQIQEEQDRLRGVRRPTRG